MGRPQTSFQQGFVIDVGINLERDYGQYYGHKRSTVKILPIKIPDESGQAGASYASPEA